MSPGRLVDLKAAFAEAGLHLASLTSIRRSVIDARHGEANLAYSHRTIDAAATLDVPVVSVGLHQELTPEQKKELWFWSVRGHVDRPCAETWEKAVNRLRELGRHADEVGIVMSLEMYEDTYLGTAESAIRLLEAVGLDNVGLNPDVGNLVRLPRPVEDWRVVHRSVLPYANFWHVKNYLRYENVARDLYVAIPTSLDLGLIDYREVFGMAIASGFQGVITAEAYGGDALAVAARAETYLRKQILPMTADYALGQSRVRQQVRRREALPTPGSPSPRSDQDISRSTR
jgi:sugar phosphate isomerase/epimerase